MNLLFFRTFWQKLYAFLCIFVKKRHEYSTLDSDDTHNKNYYKNYGIKTIQRKNGTIKYKVIKKRKLKLAYNKAWEIRNFEIERYWQRTAYFWGFIVLIFTGYIYIVIQSHNDNIINKYLDFYLIALGLVFSVGWFLVLLGSKTWQQNWESHIDMLEGFVSGPLYRIINYRGRVFYSVSKINQVLAIAVILVWVGLFFQYIKDYKLCSVFSKDLNKPVSIVSVLVIVFIVVLIFGYPVADYKSKKNNFFDRWE